MRLKQNLDQIIYNEIINALIMHEYEMGDTILLDTLAEKYGVSRTPIVQATKLLANDGVIDIMRNGRVCIPTFTSDQINQICNVRILLECYALDEIFKNDDEEAFADISEKLQAAANEAYKLKTSQSILEFNKADLNFHLLLVKGSNNEFLADLYKRIKGRFVVANYLSMEWGKYDFTSSAESHLDIVNAFKNKDLEQCKALLTQHIHSVYERDRIAE